jgi:prepilin-type N-terminal cleavage/methylation domain-containing protein
MNTTSKEFTLYPRASSLHKKSGFTLIELLVVVAIIGILATVVLSSLSSARESARDAKRLNDVKTIQTALEMYANDNGGLYPIIPSWAGSHSDSWADLEEILGTTLPVDPLNKSDAGSSAAAFNDGYVYSYYARDGSDQCNGKGYMLVFNLEGKKGNGNNDGVTLCPHSRSYGDAFVIGMDGKGRLKTPDLSGDPK